MHKYGIGLIIGLFLGVSATAGAIALNAESPWENTYNTSNATITNIWDRLDAIACADVDTDLQMTAGTCSAEMNPCSVGTVLSLTCLSGGQTRVSSKIAIPGTWVP